MFFVLHRVIIAICVLAFTVSVHGAPLPSGHVDARAALQSSSGKTVRQANLVVQANAAPVSTTDAHAGQRAVRVTFNGYFNVTATVWVPANETDAISGKPTTPWTVTAALNLSALRGPVAVTFGASGAHAGAELDAHSPSADAAALGGTVRVSNTSAAGFGAATARSSGDAHADAGGGPSVALNSTAFGSGAVSARTATGQKAEAGTAGFALGDGSLEGQALAASEINGAAGAAAVGTTGEVYRGMSYARGGVDVDGSKDSELIRLTRAVAQGQGSSNLGGGGSGAVAGAAARAVTSHEATR